MEAEAKPKRVLTEAQRLAFLKGREKRMANIEKKKLEAEEAKQVQVQENAEPAPVPVPVPVQVPVPVPEPTHIDEDKLAASITERVLRGIQETKPKRKPYTRKPKPVVADEPESKPVVNNFSWL